MINETYSIHVSARFIFIILPDYTACLLGIIQCRSNRLLVCRRLEADIKRLKSDLQSSRQVEQELRSQINTLINGERQAKGDIQQLQHDNDQLQNK